MVDVFFHHGAVSPNIHEFKEPIIGVFLNYFAYLDKNPYLCTVYRERSSVQVIQGAETLARNRFRTLSNDSTFL